VATFSTGVSSGATVTAEIQEVWQALTDPGLLAHFTPFLHTVREEGPHWVWQLSRIPVLGSSFSFTFRERMTFHEPRRIDFTHDPAPGATEHAGVEGWYALEPLAVGTRLEASLHITVELPFPGVLAPAVTTAMRGVLAVMQQRFSHNLVAHLGARTV
jgi:carbon monoxide dehydrogenase subunit G